MGKIPCNNSAFNGTSKVRSSTPSYYNSTLIKVVVNGAVFYAVGATHSEAIQMALHEYRLNVGNDQIISIDTKQVNGPISVAHPSFSLDEPR